MTTTAITSVSSPPNGANAHARSDWWAAHQDALLERLRQPIIERWVPIELVDADLDAEVGAQ